MPIGTYRSKPVPVEAMQWNGHNYDELFAWGGGHDNPLTAKITWAWADTDLTKLAVQTTVGVLHANIGDWVIKSTEGNFFRITADAFCTLYERA